MPAILKPEDYEAWLNPGQGDAASLAPLLGPFPADEMEAHPVSTRVNSVANDDAALLDEADEVSPDGPAESKPGTDDQLRLF